MLHDDLDAALTAALRGLAAGGQLAAAAGTSGTWRPAPGRDPAGFASSLPLRLARATQSDPAGLAAALARELRQQPWIRSAEPDPSGYLTVTVTAGTLAAVAGSIVAAGPGCAHSTALAGCSAVITPWPDLAAARDWQHAWHEQAVAMSGRQARAAGATASRAGERRAPMDAADVTDSPVRAAVSFYGLSAIRYRIARTLPGKIGQLAAQVRRGSAVAWPLTVVQAGHAEAASTLRWAADLHLERAACSADITGALTERAEFELLSLLSWLPVRVASAARRSRPGELPRYLELVAEAWQACRQHSPALPFGGQAAPAGPAVTGARLLLADAARTVLAAGLALTGIAPADRL